MDLSAVKICRRRGGLNGGYNLRVSAYLCGIFLTSNHLADSCAQKTDPGRDTMLFGCFGRGRFHFAPLFVCNLCFWHPPIALRAYFSIGFYFISITLAYIITYSAIEADSPSLMIIMKIHEAGESGFKMESLEADLNNSSVILPRLKDLLIDKMAELEEGKYRLRAKGRLMAKLFSCYRNLMGAGKGG